jgi:transposase
MIDNPPKKIKKPKQQKLNFINPNAAGVDIGSRSHFVAIPEGRCEKSVREFSTFTNNLLELVSWLKQNKITTVAMESTGVYWIPIYDILEQHGFEVLLVNARHVRNVPGKKTDVSDCQWIQRLHSYGLLRGSFRPKEQILEMRTLMRQRATLVEYAACHLQHMQKSLSQMNIQLANVISDIGGVTGMKIIRAIVAGERNPEVLARYRETTCKNSIETIRESLIGNYRVEHIFCLKQALELHDFYSTKIRECENEIREVMSKMESVQGTGKEQPRKKMSKKHAFTFDMQEELLRVTGVNLTAIPGFNVQTASRVISEIGLDMSKWPTSKHFASWLGLCPGNKVSGGKILSGKTAPSANKAAAALRMAANALRFCDSSLGAFFRRKNGVLGAAKTITAVAHKLAIILYNMLKNGVEYIESGVEYYEEQYRDRCIKSLRKRAEGLGFTLVKASPV